MKGNERVIAVLNELLADELTAINQYMVHSEMCADWGYGDIREHHKWWMSHFPRTAGRRNGISNNWWKYIANPNNVVP